MKLRLRSVWPLALVLLCAQACRHGSGTDSRPEQAPPQSDRVNEIFEMMASGRYAGRGFPELSWDDIPALLERGASEREFKAFPRNPLSSQYEPQCREGMMALWLIEGIRKGERFASNNALCFSGRVEGRDWTEASEANHAEALGAYRRWWEQVGGLPREQAAELDPFDGTKLNWF